MTGVTLHRTPRGRDVVLEQIRVAGLGLRIAVLVVAVVLAAVTVLIAVDIARGHAATWFDSDDWSPIALVSFLVPFAVWRGEKRFGPAFLWTLPVDRRTLALAKVFAGWVWLMAAFVIFVVWQLALAAVAGVTDAEIVPALAFAGATAMYLLGSALVLGLRHPLRWLLGAAGGMYLLNTLNEALGLGVLRPIEPFLSSSSYPPAFISILWLGAGLIALWLAVSRHGERPRR